MSDTVISVEGLGKRYRIAHQAERQRYVALRDVLADKFTAPLRWLKARGQKPEDRGQKSALHPPASDLRPLDQPPACPPSSDLRSPTSGPDLRPPFSVLCPLSSRNGCSPLHRTMQLELRRYMHNQLLRDSDVFGMAHGLEIRVPFIDHVIAELLFRTDPAIILQGAAKSLLFDALPTPLPRLCTHRPKMGFTFPFDRWMKGAWRPMFEEALLESARAGNGNLFDRGAVERLWRAYVAGKVHWSKPWAVYAAMRESRK